MAFKVYNVTMTGSAVRATSAHLPISYLRIENETSNADVKVGDSGVGAADYGMIVEATPAKPKVVGPFPHGLMNLDQIYFLGTNNEIIHLTVVTP